MTTKKLKSKGGSNGAKKLGAVSKLGQQMMARTVDQIFNGSSDDLHKALLSRIQLVGLRARQPVTADAMAIASHQHGNCRVKLFAKIEARFGLRSVFETYMQAHSRNSFRARFSKLHFDFPELRKCVLDCRNSLGKAGRVVYMEFSPMILGTHSLIEAESFTPPKTKSVPTRITVKSGDNTIAHALLLARPTLGPVQTADQSLRAAAENARDGDPVGLFVCHPDESAQIVLTDRAELLESTTAAVDLLRCAALFIVWFARLFAKRSEIVLTLADGTGMIDPVALKREILRHGIKTRLNFAYLPTRRSA